MLKERNFLVSNEKNSSFLIEKGTISSYLSRSGFLFHLGSRRWDDWDPLAKDIHVSYENKRVPTIRFDYKVVKI